MWPFKRKKLDPGNAGFDESAGTYVQVWENKFRLDAFPSPGAQAYAWETLDAVPFTPIGAGVHRRTPIVPTSQPMAVRQAVLLNGVPTIAGQIVGQPLFDPQAPNGGFVKQSDPVNYNDPGTAMNVPSYMPSNFMTNDPNPFDARAKL